MFDAMNEKELLEVEKWARLSVEDHKFYVGLVEALDKLTKARKDKEKNGQLSR